MGVGGGPINVGSWMVNEKNKICVQCSCYSVQLVGCVGVFGTI